ncbi:hypothetical protein RA265_30285, partial [Pseudomonas syringae pv. tagetis]|uniref:hypothetical protein n=1 Tax=Pseudomonas syringae group genomosp. 7 TaxID=251699 RepID=UPI00376FC59C
YRTASGALLDPAIGASHVTGIMGELFDKRLNVSLAVFYVNQKDVAIEDQGNAGQCPGNDAYGTCYLNGDIRRSKGVD